MFALFLHQLSTINGMTIFFLQTLVDISDNGPLNKGFPFKTKNEELVHDKHTLQIAKNQQHNFNTLIQSIQIRANIGWDQSPMSTNIITANTKFGKAYEGKHKSWAFVFHTEQADVYDDGKTPTGLLEQDLDCIPIINFCKETATFLKNAFLTQDDKTRNTYVLKVDDTQHITSQRDTVKELLESYRSEKEEK